MEINDKKEKRKESFRQIVMWSALFFAVLSLFIFVFTLGFLLNNSCADCQKIKPVNNEKAFNQNKDSSITDKEKSAEQDKVRENWLFWKHDVLGLSFSYPESWGEITTSPSRYITNLSTINEGHDSEHNKNTYGISITFSNHAPDLYIFNDKYPGEYFPNSQTYYLGPIDNLELLKDSGDICKYKIELRNNPTNTGTIYEKSSSCKEAIKSTFSEREDFCGSETGCLYSYSLKSYAYKRMLTKTHKHLLIDYLYGYSSQIDHQINKEEFYQSKTNNRGLVSKEQYEKELADFKKFVDSIEIYEPITEEKEDVLELPGEDMNMYTIRKYYSYLNQGMQEEAYELYGEKSVTFSKYLQWYKNLYQVHPSEIKRLSANNYQVMLKYQDHNSAPQVYRVKMNVKDDQISTLSSEEITSDIVERGDSYTFTKIEKNTNYLVYYNGEEELVVDTIEPVESSDGMSLIRSFSNPYFSQLGNYLIVNEGSMAGYRYLVYDLSDFELIIDFPFVFDLGFSSGERYLYACASSLYSGDQYVHIYSVPEFDKIGIDLKDLSQFEGVIDIGCDYDNESDVLKIEIDELPLNKDDVESGMIYYYDFKTGNIEKVN